MARQIPTDADRRIAIGRLLRGLADGADAIVICAAIVDLHPKNDTFPGEVFLHVGATALDLAGASAENPVAYEGLLDTHLAECSFRGRENRKIQFAILGMASTRGGIEPDLLDETYWWKTDDFWRYALLGAIAVIRASAARMNISAAELAARIAAAMDIDLGDPPAIG
jgi:hypothetical protein